MSTFLIPINLDLKRRGFREGYKPLHLSNEPKISGQCHSLCTAPWSMTTFTRKQYPNSIIRAGYSNVLIWLERVTCPNTAIWLVRDTYPLMRLYDWCEIHTLMLRSDWCEQRTTLYATDFFFNKKDNSTSNYDPWISALMASSFRVRNVGFSALLTCILPRFMRNAILLDRWKISDYL